MTLVDPQIRGVYAPGPAGRPMLVHAFVDEAEGGGDYALADVVSAFQLGAPGEPPEEGITILTLTAKELRQLEACANADSFDHDPFFIEMCLDLARHAAGASEGSFTFAANF